MKNVFDVADIVSTILPFLTVFELGNVCKTSSSNYNLSQRYYRRHKSRVFHIEYNDVRMDVAAFNSMKRIFDRIPYNRGYTTMAKAVEYLNSRNVYSDDKGRWCHIVDEWNAYYRPGITY